MARSILLHRGWLVLAIAVSIGLAGCTREKPAQAPNKGWGTPRPTIAATAAPQSIPASPTLVSPKPTAAQETGVTPLPTATTSVPTPASTGSATTYTVQRGDTLFRIAQRFNTDVETIQKLNGLTNTFIYVGQVLRVPGAGPVVVSGPTTYVVQSGDTLANIAGKFGVNVSDLIKANSITDPNVVVVGQKLTIPTTAPSSSSEKTYVVQQGDTLAKIAVRFGVTIADLVKTNDLENPDSLKVGQTLRIP